MKPGLMLTHLRLAGWEPVDTGVLGFQRVADGFTVYACNVGHMLVIQSEQFNPREFLDHPIRPEHGAVELQVRAMICLVQHMEDLGMIAKISGVPT